MPGAICDTNRNKKPSRKVNLSCVSKVVVGGSGRPDTFGERRIMGKRKNRAEPERRGTPIDLESSAERVVSLETLAADDPNAVALYLADVIGQLERIARASNHNLLAYLLAMASVQAADGHLDPGRSYSIH